MTVRLRFANRTHSSHTLKFLIMVIMLIRKIMVQKPKVMILCSTRLNSLKIINNNLFLIRCKNLEEESVVCTR